MNRFVRCSLSAVAGVALVTCAGAAARAQNPASSSQQTQQSPAAQNPSPTTQTTTPQTQTPATQSQAGASEAQPQQAQKKIEMVQAQAELNTTLDAKKAKQGEPVKARLSENVQIPDAQPLPKNTVLEGHVDQVTASAHKGDSTMVVTFDKAKLKDGQELPIKATVIAVSEPALAMQQGGGAPAGGAMPSASGGGMPSGGGTAPQSGGGSRGSGSSAGSSSGASSGGAQQPMMPDASGGSQQQGSGGVPDVKLTSDIHQQTSATFTSTGKNVHVPGGTQMQMEIAVIPAGVHIQ
ncbi:MAG TPA: hypothetical protein VIY53_00655 [Acidobacteriaceae bacterium]